MTKSILRAVRNMFGGGRKTNVTAKAQTFRKVRLSLEQLEQRDCPAAMTFYVNGLGDAGAGAGDTGDLRYCVTQANANDGADTIVFINADGAGLTGTINLLAQPLNITESVTISGTGAAVLTIARSNAPLTANFELIRISAGVQCTVDGLGFTNGRSMNVGEENADPGRGGAIRNLGGHLAANNCWFWSNYAENSGGAIFNDTDGTVQLDNCAFWLNEAGAAGGAIYSQGVSVEVFLCQLYSNESNGFGGAINIASGTLQVNDSQIYGNASTAGGGLALHVGTSATIGYNTSIYGNDAALGGGIWMNAFDELVTTLNVSNSTIENNEATQDGGGIYMEGTSVATLSNTTTIANNIAPPNLGDGISYQFGKSSLFNYAYMLNDIEQGHA